MSRYRRLDWPEPPRLLSSGLSHVWSGVELLSKVVFRRLIQAAV